MMMVAARGEKRHAIAHALRDSQAQHSVVEPHRPFEIRYLQVDVPDPHAPVSHVLCRFFLVRHGPWPGPALDFVAVRVFGRNIVFGNFGCGHFALIRVFGIFDAAHSFRLERLPFFQQLFHALGIEVFPAGKPLRVARLSAGI